MSRKRSRRSATVSTTEVAPTGRDVPQRPGTQGPGAAMPPTASVHVGSASGSGSSATSTRAGSARHDPSSPRTTPGGSRRGRRPISQGSAITGASRMLVSARSNRTGASSVRAAPPPQYAVRDAEKESAEMLELIDRLKSERASGNQLLLVPGAQPRQLIISKGVKIVLPGQVDVRNALKVTVGFEAAEGAVRMYASQAAEVDQDNYVWRSNRKQRQHGQIVIAAADDAIQTDVPVREDGVGLFVCIVADKRSKVSVRLTASMRRRKVERQVLTVKEQLDRKLDSLRNETSSDFAASRMEVANAQRKKRARQRMASLWSRIRRAVRVGLGDESAEDAATDAITGRTGGSARSAAYVAGPATVMSGVDHRKKKWLALVALATRTTLTSVVLEQIERLRGVDPHTGQLEHADAVSGSASPSHANAAANASAAMIRVKARAEGSEAMETLPFVSAASVAGVIAARRQRKQAEAAAKVPVFRKHGVMSPSHSDTSPMSVSRVALGGATSPLRSPRNLTTLADATTAAGKVGKTDGVAPPRRVKIAAPEDSTDPETPQVTAETIRKELGASSAVHAIDDFRFSQEAVADRIMQIRRKIVRTDSLQARRLKGARVVVNPNKGTSIHSMTKAAKSRAPEAGGSKAKQAVPPDKPVGFRDRDKSHEHAPPMRFGSSMRPELLSVASLEASARAEPPRVIGSKPSLANWFFNALREENDLGDVPSSSPTQPNGGTSSKRVLESGFCYVCEQVRAVSRARSRRAATPRLDAQERQYNRPAPQRPPARGDAAAAEYASGQPSALPQASPRGSVPSESSPTHSVRSVTSGDLGLPTTVLCFCRNEEHSLCLEHLRFAVNDPFATFDDVIKHAWRFSHCPIPHTRSVGPAAAAAVRGAVAVAEDRPEVSPRFDVGGDNAILARTEDKKYWKGADFAALSHERRPVPTPYVPAPYGQKDDFGNMYAKSAGRDGGAVLPRAHAARAPLSPKAARPPAHDNRTMTVRERQARSRREVTDVGLTEAVRKGPARKPQTNEPEQIWPPRPPTPERVAREKRQASRRGRMLRAAGRLEKAVSSAEPADSAKGAEVRPAMSTAGSSHHERADEQVAFDGADQRAEGTGADDSPVLPGMGLRHRRTRPTEIVYPPHYAKVAAANGTVEERASKAGRLGKHALIDSATQHAYEVEEGNVRAAIMRVTAQPAQATSAGGVELERPVMHRGGGVVHKGAGLHAVEAAELGGIPTEELAADRASTIVCASFVRRRGGSARFVKSGVLRDVGHDPGARRRAIQRIAQRALKGRQLEGL